jgi:hypothetical protein
MLKSRRKFSEEEDDFLRTNYPILGWRYCAKQLNRTEKSIQSRARNIQIKGRGRNFTKEDDIFLRENYIKLGVGYCTKQLNRTEKSVYDRISFLKKKENFQSLLSFYNQEEDNFIKQYYPIYGPEYCAKNLKRTKKSIIRRAFKLKIKTNRNYIKEGDDLIKKYYPEYGARYCADLLNQTKESVLRRASRLKIKRIYYWSETEDNLLKKYYPKYGPQYCSNLLNKTRSSVRMRAHHLKLKKRSSTNELIDLFAKYYQIQFGNEYCNKISNLFYRELRHELHKTYEGRKILWIVDTLDSIKKKCTNTDIDYDFMYSIFPEYCPILGIKLEPSQNKNVCVRASTDRINSNLDYTKSNVAIISHRANNIKRDASIIETQNLIKYLEGNELNFRKITKKEEKRIDTIFYSRKGASTKKKQEFNLTKGFLYSIVPQFCPITGNELDFSGRNRKNSPSVDRLDNNKGYTIDNVRIISHQGNCLKGQGSLEEHRKIYEYLKNNLIN